MTEQFEWEKPSNMLNFEVVREDLNTLIVSTENNIDRNWPARLGGIGLHNLMFLYFVKTTKWTLKATQYLLADNPPDPIRRLEFALAVPPLNRTLLDMLFNVIFIFDDYETRLCWYFDSGRREIEKKVSRFTKAYKGKPLWDKWLDDFEKSKDVHVLIRDKVCAGGCSPPKKWFPHPGGILKENFKDPSLKDFLKFLNDWYYRDLSSASHGHWSGLAERVGQALRVEDGDDKQMRISTKYKSDCFFTQVVLILCLIGEITHFAGFTNKPKVAYLWTIVSKYWEVAEDLYSMRYQAILQ